MIAYKLLRKMKDGSLSPLFINKKSRTPIGLWFDAETHPTKRYKIRKGWNCLSKPDAPHLTYKGRIWCEVEIDDYIEIKRPNSQGGLWFLAQRMRIIREL